MNELHPALQPPGARSNGDPRPGDPRHIGAPAPVEPRGVAVAVVAPEATERDVRRLVEHVRAAGVEASVYDVGPGVILLSDVSVGQIDAIIGHDRAVERVFLPDTPYRLARREVQRSGTIVHIGGVPFGGDSFGIIAGPCAVEGAEAILQAARACAANGAVVLRGGAFKPRSSPYRFQGHGVIALEWLAAAREATGLPVVSECLAVDMIETMYPYVDAFQVGARNMQNFDLLRALSDIDKPIVLKRGFAATVEEWLLAAEYLLAGGNDQVILVERGIRTFNDGTRFTLDLASMALAKRETHLPVIVDPSHATGEPALIAPMTFAALAAGADGVMIEVHPAPHTALSDGDQAIRPHELGELTSRLGPIAAAVGRVLTMHPVGERR